MAITARAAKRLPIRLDTANAIVDAKNVPVLSSVIAVRGKTASCAPAAKSPTNSSNEASFDVKIVRRESGSAMRIRKSVWSGKSE